MQQCNEPVDRVLDVQTIGAFQMKYGLFIGGSRGAVPGARP